MKEEQQKIDPIEESLKLLFVSEVGISEDALNSSFYLQLITEANYEVSPDHLMGKDLVDKLYNELSVDSLGSLITKATKNIMTIEYLASISSLPVATVELLQQDKIIANSVPVMSLKRLLDVLKISFAKAQEGIQKSFQIMRDEATFSSGNVGKLGLAYKRRNGTDAAVGHGARASKAETVYLFQNEESLGKYVARLKEIYEKTE